MIDAYCERVSPGLLAEPLNAFSNISFLIAAWAAWRLAARYAKLTVGIRVLIMLGFLVGIGSILWHTYPTETTLILDIVPIVLFIIWFIWVYAQEVMAVGTLAAAGFVVLFLAATYIAASYAGVLHGAPVYTPGLVVVLFLGVYHLKSEKPARFMLLAAAGVYFLALFYRTIDQEVCHVIPIGTHFIWHSLIGFVTYLAMRGLILGSPERR